MVDVKLSTKGQIVIPKEIRIKLGIKPGDKLRVEVGEDKKILISAATEPPSEIFVRAGSKRVDAILREADKIDEAKVKRLLRALSAK
jgi:AbrB family looped-hinge helix DNA binding protein